ncbi:MAG: ABC transporter substrate-binding protein [Acidimicrobiaceae bacterium]|nr:ABC transporter substrate-binding protein [Acidimicrobiaceae bacterium]
MPNSKSRRNIVSLLAVGSIALAACGSSSSSPASSSGSPTTSAAPAITTINVAYDPNATALPAWIAQDEGIFAKNNLKVNFTKIQNLSTLPGTLGNTFDIVLSTPTELISAAASGLPVVEVSGSSVDSATNPASALVVSPTSGIQTLADLEGKTVGTLTLNGTLTYALEYDLFTHGLNPKGIKFVTMAGPTMVDNLKANNVPAVLAVPPFITALVKAGNTELLKPYDAVGSSLASIFWIADSTWTSKNPTAVKEFVNSLNQAQTYISANDQTARSVLAKYTGLPVSVIQSFTFPVFNTALRPQDLTSWENVMVKLGVIKNPPPVSSLQVK